MPTGWLGRRDIPLNSLPIPLPLPPREGSRARHTTANKLDVLRLTGENEKLERPRAVAAGHAWIPSPGGSPSDRTPMGSA